jgi:soluble lytic murein transglycosylase-like protein
MEFRAIIGVLCLAAPLAAGEYAVLATGFRVHAERHEKLDNRVRLFTGDGSIDLPAAQVVSFEAEEYVPAPPAPAAAAQPAAVLSPRELVEQAARKQGLPANFVHLVAQAESGYQVNAVSPKGAVGLMQLMPETARMLGADANDPAQNVEAGVRYLRELLLKYQDKPDQVRRALAAYNAGPGAVERYDGVPPYRETQMYVEKVLSEYKRRTEQPVN